MVKEDKEKLDRIAFLESGLNELRNIHNAIGSSYDSMKTKALALLAGEIGIVTFLFANSSNTQATPVQSAISISNAVFYIISFFLLSAAFLLFIHVISPGQWKIPPESHVIKHMREWFNNDKEKFILYLHDEYQEAISICNSKLSAKAKRFVYGIYLLVSGILLLVLLKYGKGTITI